MSKPNTSNIARVPKVGVDGLIEKSKTKQSLAVEIPRFLLPFSGKILVTIVMVLVLEAPLVVW